MDTKTYENDITIRKEKDTVFIINPITSIAMKRSTFMAIVADNVKEVMRGNSEPSEPYIYHSPNVTFPNDSITEKV